MIKAEKPRKFPKNPKHWRMGSRLAGQGVFAYFFDYRGVLADSPHWPCLCIIYSLFVRQPSFEETINRKLLVRRVTKRSIDPFILFYTITFCNERPNDDILKE